MSFSSCSKEVGQPVSRQVVLFEQYCDFIPRHLLKAFSYVWTAALEPSKLPRGEGLSRRCLSYA
jgi:hypothetical protein